MRDAPSQRRLGSPRHMTRHGWPPPAPPQQAGRRCGAWILGLKLIVVCVLLPGCTRSADDSPPKATSKSAPVTAAPRPSMVAGTLCWGLSLTEVEELSGLTQTLLVDDRSCAFRDSNGENTLSVARDPSVSKDSDANRKKYAQGLVPRPGHLVIRPAGPARPVIDIDIDSATGQGVSFPPTGGSCSVFYVRAKSSSAGTRAPFSEAEKRNAVQLVTHALSVCGERPPPTL